ncbi:MAG TPA: SH3 domain-containing protein [Phototrophicaceae bacterium]|nr:SH3 domain-containing protein [Phototrophicaceae bacterium]
MKKLLFLLFLLGCFTGLVSAQETESRLVSVNVESAFVRIAPDFAAEPVASLFEQDRVEVVSRNLDGTWYEVRRPGRLNNLGWVFNETLNWKFKPEFLPLGDLTTGVIGPHPLTAVPPFGVYMLEEAILREQPGRSAPAITKVPYLLTIPVLERNQDGTWLHVNYLGYDGWIAVFAARRLPNVMDIPEAPGLPALNVPAAVIIPVEIQQAQIDRLRAFMNDRKTLAGGLEAFWWKVFRGEVMPCDAPPELTYYPYGEEDVRELPELQRYTPRVIIAIDLMKTARDPFLTCGVVAPETVIDARNAATNARVIFEVTLDSLKNLEENVVQYRRPRK